MNGGVISMDRPSLSAHPGEPVYSPLVRDVRESIANGTRRPCERLPSEVELAERYGVSRASVRQALAALASDGLVERVPGRGTFVARPGGSTSAAEPKRIAVIVNHLADTLSARIVAGISNAAMRLGLEIMLGSTWNDPLTEAALLRRSQERGDAGVILFPTDGRLVEDPVHRARGSGMPIVLVDRELPGIGVDVARAAHLEGAAAAVRHLIQAGHRDIAFLTTDQLATPSVAERLRGYRQALTDAGLPFRWDRVWLVPRVEKPVDNVAPAGPERGAFLGYLHDTARPTAVFALNDLLASALLTLAAEIGIDVPGELSVAGFDGLVSHVSGRRLTTVRQPAEAIGAKAVELLAGRIGGRAPATPVVCTLAVDLIVGETTGPAFPRSGRGASAAG